tara:strand:- start:23 stop:184 length:162 start_codon:yes stop_codon:yes gene_type:complete
LCLEKDEKDRPNCEKLLTHPFIVKNKESCDQQRRTSSMGVIINSEEGKLEVSE